MKPPNVKCLFCEKECYMPAYRLKTFKFCSRTCKDKSNAIKTTQNCAICAKKFEHISCRANKAKYCSRQCYYTSQKNKGKMVYKCHHCDKKFMGHAAHKRKYCSVLCRGKGQKETWHPKFSTVRKKMLAEGYIQNCEKCGYDQVKEILGVHHIDGNRNNNCRENLMTLCPNCHSLIHKKHIPH